MAHPMLFQKSTKIRRFCPGFIVSWKFNACALIQDKIVFPFNHKNRYFLPHISILFTLFTDNSYPLHYAQLFLLPFFSQDKYTTTALHISSTTHLWLF